MYTQHHQQPVLALAEIVGDRKTGVTADQSGQEGQLLPGKGVHAQTQYPPMTGAAKLLAEKSA